MKAYQRDIELDDADDYLITEMMAFRRWLDAIDDAGREEAWIQAIDEAIECYLNATH
jgi:hypothetical protein